MSEPKRIEISVGEERVGVLRLPPEHGQAPGSNKNDRRRRNAQSTALPETVSRVLPAHNRASPDVRAQHSSECHTGRSLNRDRYPRAG